MPSYWKKSTQKINPLLLLTLLLKSSSQGFKTISSDNLDLKVQSFFKKYPLRYQVDFKTNKKKNLVVFFLQIQKDQVCI